MARLLELEGISKSFGGLNVIQELDLHVDEGEIVSVIGPNGAGKTTLFNLVTGVYQPDGGDIRFEKQSVVGLQPHEITGRGIARTFQTLRLFLNMTVKENVMAAAWSHTHAGILRSILRTPGMRREEREINRLAEERLSFFGERLMGYRWNQPAYSLSYANRRRLEIARATATQPRILLLDEPAAGMNPSETHEITELIGKLREERGGELVCLLGGNASGKSTTLKTILGIVRPRTGKVLLDGEDVTRRPTSYRIGRGIAIVPENRRLFAPMTVLENLEMGAYLRGGGAKEDFERVYSLFPLLYERRAQLAGTLSGGEQQMVAMGRALMSRPKLLLIDEPSVGLAPILVERSFEIIHQVHEAGVAMLVVEQNANMALSIADRGYVLSTGRLVLAGSEKEL